MYMYLHLLVGLGTFKRYLCGTGKSTIDTEKRFIKNWYQKQTKKITGLKSKLQYQLGSDTVLYMYSVPAQSNETFCSNTVFFFMCL